MTEHGATSTDRAEPGGISVAIVDDQPHFYPRLIAEQLTAAGHHVVHRVERVEDLPPEPVDVVLCDVRLVRRGGSSGERAVALLVAAGHRVLLTSALAREEEVLDAIAAGAVGYLSKERPAPEHVSALVSVARSGVFVGRELAVVLVADARRRPLTRRDLASSDWRVLRALARGDTPEDLVTELRLAPSALVAAQERILDAARRRRAVGRLTPRAREILQLVAGEHLSRTEIAARLAITDDTLGEHLARIRAYYLRLRPDDVHVKPMAAAEALARLCGVGEDDRPAGVS